LIFFICAFAAVQLSATKFMAATKMDGMTQRYCYEFGTYKTDINNTPIDLNGLDYVFEGFTQKIELTTEPLEVNQPTEMPFWARSEIVNAAQIASTCSAVTCEQTIVNLVASIYLAAAETTKVLISLKTYKHVQQFLKNPVPKSHKNYTLYPKQVT
jgi:hypothetical protein